MDILSGKFLLGFVTLLMSVESTAASARIMIPLNDNWKFSKGDFADAAKLRFNDSGWIEVCLPHTWNNLDGQDGGGDYYRGPGWYRNDFYVSKEFSGKRIFVRFGAAGMIAEVYVNGNLVGEHRGGFAAFVFDITGFLNCGKNNLIAVRVDNSSPKVSDKFKIAPLSADFTMDGGLYRTAELIVTDELHISLTDYGSTGLYVTQKEVSDDLADITVKTRLSNDTKRNQNVSVHTAIYDAEGRLVKGSTAETAFGAAVGRDLTQELKLERPHLWNGRINPYLYKIVVSVYQKDQLLDEVEQPLGLRYYKVDPEMGFSLNGKPYELHGVALHEDKEDKGRAITSEDRKQEMNCILDIGATMVRFAHYQYDQEMYQLCDKNGIVVWTEIPLVNQIDSSETFAENAEQQLRELIRQNYNHASVFFWGIFNEILNVKGPDPTPLVRRLNVLAKQEDSTRLTTSANMNDFPSAFVTDVLGLNKYFGWYDGKVQDLGPYLDKWHTEHPDRAIGLSEYGAGGSVYQHEEDPKQPRTDGPWHPEEYQTFYHEVSWKTIESRPYIWFSTIWNMFDFASDSRNEGFQPGTNDKGIIAHDHETKKDSYYWYKVNWSDDSLWESSSPMIHINCKMFTVRDTDVISVEVYSNSKEVELFVNGKSGGKISGGDHRFFWKNVRLAEGLNQVKAVAIVDGKEVFDQCWWRCEK